MQDTYTYHVSSHQCLLADSDQVGDLVFQEVYPSNILFPAEPPAATTNYIELGVGFQDVKCFVFTRIFGEIILFDCHVLKELKIPKQDQ